MMQGFRFRRHDDPSVDKFVAETIGRFELLVLLEGDGRDRERGRHAGMVAR